MKCRRAETYFIYIIYSGIIDSPEYPRSERNIAMQNTDISQNFTMLDTFRKEFNITCSSFVVLIDMGT